MMGSKLEWLAEKLGRLEDAPVRKRLHSLFDSGSFRELDAFVSAGVITGCGTVEGSIVYVFAQDREDAGAGMGKAQVEKIAKLYDLAVKTGCPVVAVYDSAGARLDEGAEVLEAYSRLISCVASVSGVVPQVAVVTGLCAGSAAVAACGADVVIVAKDAELFVTPPAIAKANGTGVSGAGTAQAAAQAGVAHILAADEADAFAKARLALTLLPGNNLTPTAVFDTSLRWGEGKRLVQAAQAIESADMAEIAQNILDAKSLLELQNEYGKGIYTALGTLAGNVTAVAATTGSPLTAQDAAKLARLVQLADAFQIPVLTIINTPGFEQSSLAEAAGSIQAAARLSQLYSEATTPKVALIAGRAYSLAAVALAQADVRLAWPCATVSPLAPETAVALLYEDRITPQRSRAQVVEEYCANEASAQTAASTGYVNIVTEPENTAAVLANIFDLLASKRVNKMPKKRANIPM